MVFLIKMKKILIIAVVFLGTVFSSSSQTQCKQELIGYYKKLDRSSATMVQGKTFVMQYAMKAVYTRSGKIDSSLINASIQGNNKIRSFSSESMRVFQDELVTVSVSDQDKEIHVIKTPLRDFRANSLSKIQFIQDTVIQSARNIECKTGPNGTKLFYLSFLSNQRHLNGLKRMKVVIKNGSFKVIELNYFKGSQYDRAQIEFQKINFDAQLIGISEKALDNIYSKGNLKPQYNGYKVYDHRNN